MNNRRRTSFASDADYSHWGEEASIIREAEERHAPNPDEYYYNPEEDYDEEE